MRKIIILHIFLLFTSNVAVGQNPDGNIIILAQTDEEREAAQKELEDALKREKEQMRQDCEKQRADALSSCLSGATSVVLSCQSSCNAISDAAASNDCKRACSDAEYSERMKCTDAERAMNCN